SAVAGVAAQALSSTVNAIFGSHWLVVPYDDYLQELVNDADSAKRVLCMDCVRRRRIRAGGCQQGANRREGIRCETGRRRGCDRQDYQYRHWGCSRTEDK